MNSEKIFLGGLMLEPFFLEKNMGEALSPDDFFESSHRKIYQAALNLMERKQPTEYLFLVDELKGEVPPVEIADVASYGQVSTLLPFHAKKIFLDSQKRKLKATLQDGSEELNQKSFEEVLDKAQRSFDILSKRTITENEISIRQAIKDEFDRIEKCSKTKGMTGIKSGFSDLDVKTSGFQNGDLIIVAGRPSMGKTALALNFAVNAAQEIPVGIFSLEMSIGQLVQRIVSCEARIESMRIRDGSVKDNELSKVTNAMGELSKLPIHFCGSPDINPTQMRKTAKSWKQKHGVGLILIDYMQLMSVKGKESREREIGEISRSMKIMANELNIPVICLSQLNRALEARAANDRRPRLSDLRDSGSIEQDADLILFIYRDEVYNKNPENIGTAEILIGKHRNGPIGIVNLKFFSEFTKFENLEHWRGEEWN